MLGDAWTQRRVLEFRMGLQHFPKSENIENDISANGQIGIIIRDCNIDKNICVDLVELIKTTTVVKETRVGRVTKFPRVPQVPSCPPRGLEQGWKSNTGGGDSFN